MKSMNPVSTDHPIKDALVEVSKIISEISEVEPVEADTLLIEALDDSELLSTRNTKRIQRGLVEAKEFLNEIRNKNLAERFVYLRERKRAAKLHFVAKLVGAALPNVIFLVFIFFRFSSDMAKGTLPAAPAPPPSNDGLVYLDVGVYYYLFTSLGWYLGGIAARMFPRIKRHIRKATWRDVIEAIYLIATWTFLGAFMPAILQAVRPLIDPSVLAGAFFGSSGIIVIALIKYILGILAPLLLIALPFSILMEFRKR